ncbi:MAG: tetratricopeptide repeat protein, partial [Planctomycetaceae bacterium]
MTDPNQNSTLALHSPKPLAGERVTFTGVLASLTHAEAADLVREHGGDAADHVSRQLTMLVIGEEGWPLEDDGRPSRKLTEVLDWQQRGETIRIVQESDFLKMVGLAEQSSDIRRLHTPAMLSQLLAVPVHIIRGWERSGLIRPVRRVHRLPYFDFVEVAGARRLSELLQAGVPREAIERSLRAIPEFTSGDRRPFEQLDLLVRDHRVLIRDRQGLRESTGQRVFDFEGDASTPEPQHDHDAHPVTLSFLSARQQALEMERRDWFVEGCRQVDAEDLPAAIEAFRLALMTEPQNPEVHFHLGDALYRRGRSQAALERFYTAVELDHDYVEAWMQIGALHRELQELDAAVDAFSVALDIHPDGCDAHFQLAEAMAEQGDAAAARMHWQAYLAQEQRGPWADLAR